MSAEAGRPAPGDAALSWGQRRFLLVLGLPAFGLALAYTVVSTFVPVLLERLSGPAVTGLLIGAEGLLGLVVPVVVGAWSDRLRTRIGGRLPWLLVGAACAVSGLVLMPPATGSLLGLTATLMLFLIGYFVYFSPYYALYPDLVPEEFHGRSQGIQGGLRAAGLLIGLAGGGVMLSVWQPLPFVIGAVAITVTTVALAVRIRTRLGQGEGTARSTRNPIATTWSLTRTDRGLRNWVIANALWEAALAALRTFVVLYLIRGLGLSLAGASGAFVLVGVAALGAAPMAGKLADRWGARPVMLAAVWVFAIGALSAVVGSRPLLMVAVVPVAFAAVALLTLPYTVLIGLLPEDRDHAVGASLFSASRGLGILVGPALAGMAIEVFDEVSVLGFAETQGYAAAFLVTTALLLASIPALVRIEIAGAADGSTQRRPPRSEIAAQRSDRST